MPLQAIYVSKVYLDINFDLKTSLNAWTSLVAQMVKHLSTMQETRVWALGWEDSLEKEVAIHSRAIA